MFRLLVLSVSLLGLSAPTMAQDAAPPAAVDHPATGNTEGVSDALQAVFKLQSRSRSTYEDILAALSQPVRFYDLDRDGLSASELDLVDTYLAARTRAQQLTQFLSRDLDNDQRVTRQEIVTSGQLSGGLDGNSTDAVLLRFQQADVNGDGVLSWEEMSAPSRTTLPHRGTDAIRAATLAVDPTPETNFTLEDARTLTDAVFAAYDKDKNGILDPSELHNASLN